MSIQDEIKTNFEKQEELVKALRKEADKNTLASKDALELIKKDIVLNSTALESLQKKVARADFLKASEPNSTLVLEEKEKTVKFLKDSTKGQTLTPAEITNKLYNTDSAGAGGNYVTPFIDTMVDKAIRQYTNIFDICKVVSMGGTEYLKTVRSLGSQAKRGKFSSSVGVGGESVASKVTIKANAISGRFEVSDELLSDSHYNIMGEFADDVSMEIGEILGNELANGNDGTELQGLTTISNTTTDKLSLSKIESLGHDALTNFDPLISVVQLLRQGYLNDACFYMNRKTEADIMALKNTEGRYYWQPSLTAGTPASILGYPVKKIHELPNLGSGNKAIFFGSLPMAYTVVRRAMSRIQVDEITEFPSKIYKYVTYVGGALVKGQALKVLIQK